MDVVELFDSYIYEAEDLLGDLFQFIEEDQVLSVGRCFSELRALFTKWEHDYLTKVSEAIKGG